MKKILNEGDQTISDVLIHLEDDIIPNGLEQYNIPKIQNWLSEFWSYFGTGKQRKHEIQTILKYTEILDKVKKKTKFDLEEELKSKIKSESKLSLIIRKMIKEEMSMKYIDSDYTGIIETE